MKTLLTLLLVAWAIFDSLLIWYAIELRLARRRQEQAMHQLDIARIAGEQVSQAQKEIEAEHTRLRAEIDRRYPKAPHHNPYRPSGNRS